MGLANCVFQRHVPAPHVNQFLLQHSRDVYLGAFPHDLAMQPVFVGPCSKCRFLLQVLKVQHRAIDFACRSLISLSSEGICLPLATSHSIMLSRVSLGIYES